MIGTETSQQNPEQEKFKSTSPLTHAEEEVRENEDASLPDESYSFDSENTGVEEYHSADDVDEVREDDDYLQ